MNSGLHDPPLRIPQETNEREFRYSWTQSDRTNQQLNEEAVPPNQKWDIPNFSGRPSSYGSLSERERNGTKPNEQPFRRLPKFSLKDT